ncbi:hypothetical protein [Nitrincola tapanii]|uniref:Uncharacterized protein n=1 Tax=Nitrincola tapanii TaxID=1708751 RepID=A0A5A9W325_9GAMM|nr:hypothetical protein [Nitrincola tapanii]KAA0874599.1 hypothetical protein E1H14_07155 [Nitrincola tapanii]
MEYLIIFLVTFLVLIGVVLALAFGKTPGYRPSRVEVLKILQALESGELAQEQWDMFLGYPISHDPDLEEIRRDLILIHEGDGVDLPAGSGIDGYIYDRSGRARVLKVREKLELLISKEMVYKDF